MRRGRGQGGGGVEKRGGGRKEGMEDREKVEQWFNQITSNQSIKIIKQPPLLIIQDINHKTTTTAPPTTTTRYNTRTTTITTSTALRATFKATATNNYV